MLLSNVRKVIKDELSVVFLSDDKSIWCKIEQNARDYIPIDYAFYNLIYQKKYFEAVYDDYTDISVVILGGYTCLFVAVSILENGQYVYDGKQWFRSITSINC